MPSLRKMRYGFATYVSRCYWQMAKFYVQSAALLTAIKEYEASKWKVIGSKVGKPAKVCLT